MLEMFPHATALDIYDDMLQRLDESPARPSVASFNAILYILQKRMSGPLHSHVDTLDIVVRLFDAMQRRGFPPDEFSFSLAYRMCASPGNDGYLQLFENRALETLGSVGGEVACTSLMFARGKLGDVNRAEALVDHMSKSGIHINERAYACLIGLCYRKERHTQVVHYFKHVLADKNLQLTLHLTSGVIASCCRVGDGTHARLVIDALISRDVPLDDTTLDSVFGMALRIGDVNLAADLLFKWSHHSESFSLSSRLVARLIATAGRNRARNPSDEVVSFVWDVVNRAEHNLGIQLDISVFNAVADALARLGRPDEAMAVLSDEFSKRGFKADVRSYNSLVRVLGRAQKLREAISIVCNMPQHGVEPNQVTYNSLLQAAHENGDITVVRSVIAEIERNPDLHMDAIATTTVLSRLRSARNADAVRDLHAQNAREGRVLDRKAYGTILATLIECKRDTDAIGVLGWLLYRGLGGTTVFNVLIHQFGRRPHGYETAERLFSYMKRQAIVADEVTYTSMIRTCCKHKRLDRAFRLLGEMQDVGVSMADCFAWTALIDGCGRGGQWERGIDLLRQMRSSTSAKSLMPSPTTPCYNAAIYASGIHGDCWRTTLEVYKALMTDKSVTPDAVSFSAMASVVLRHRFHLSEMGIVKEVLNNLNRIIAKHRKSKPRSKHTEGNDGRPDRVDGVEVKKLVVKAKRLSWIVKFKNDSTGGFISDGKGHADGVA